MTRPRPRAQARAAGARRPPLRNEVLATFIFGLLTVQVWGAPAVALNLVLFALLVGLQPGLMAEQMVRRGFIFALPALACLSALWSMAPEVSLRYGVQLMITALMGAAIGIAVAPRAFIRVLFVAALVVSVGSLIDGGTGTSQEGLVLTGLTGSKNQISYVGQLLLAAGVAVAADALQPRLLRLATLPAFPLAAWLLWQANSATGLLTAGAGLIIFFAVWAMRLFAPTTRAVIITGLLATTIPAAITGPQMIEKAQAYLEVRFNKDAGLTGRTYLWAKADELIKDRPVLGHGYKAIFLGNSATSIGLARWSHVDPRGFHFHDTYREMAVDMGIVGLITFTLIFWATGAALTFQAISAPSVTTGFLLSLFAVLAARSKPDLVVGVFNPYFAAQFVLAIYAFGSRWTVQGLAKPAAVTVARARAAGRVQAVRDHSPRPR